MVICKNANQQKKALKLGKMVGKKVEAFIPSGKEGAKGVIYGVCADVSEKEIMDVVTFANDPILLNSSLIRMKGTELYLVQLSGQLPTDKYNKE